jgi:hypothetical protein
LFGDKGLVVHPVSKISKIYNPSLFKDKTVPVISYIYTAIWVPLRFATTNTWSRI